MGNKRMKNLTKRARIGKRFLISMIGIAAAVLLLAAGCLTVSADDSTELRIEQARIYMPDMKVYFYPGSGNAQTDTVTAMLDDEKLTTVEVYPAEQEEEGSDYYILVDVSLSIGSGYFDGIRQAIRDFKDGMGDNDTLTLITFGDTVTVAADRAQKSSDISSVVDAIAPTDNNTHLFEALDKAAELSDTEELALRRKALIVITDGEDCSTNENTKSEALEGLMKAGLPVYAMAVRETAGGAENAFVEDFSDFAREANGKLYLFGSDEASTCMSQIQTMLNSAQVAELKASSNVVRPVTQPLSLTIQGTGSESIEVYPRYGQSDNEAPSASAEQTSEKEWTITFSESVENADVSSNYKVTGPDGTVPLYAVSYHSESHAAVLTFQDALEAGEYTISMQNITDSSMEENVLTEELHFTIEAETESETETEAEEEDDGIPVWYFAVAAAVVLLILAVVLVLWRRKKKQVPPVEDAPIPMMNQISLDVRGEKENRKIDAKIENRLVVGRSRECDISLMDQLLSRKHFVIEKDSGSFYISDMGTTNGTLVNGVKLAERCKLKNGDVIQAGMLQITITW